MKWCLINAQLSPGAWVRGTILLLARDVLLSPRLVAASSTTETEDEPSYLASLMRNKTFLRGISSLLLQLCSDIYFAH